jgi:nitrogen-specific signal transduction histidine kinase
VTERVKLEEMMIHNEKMHSVGILAAGVAHEINNPATGIINLSQIIMNDSPENSGEYDIAQRIEQEGERIARIVSSLLSFSSKAPQKKISVNIHEILEGTLALTEMQLRNEGIKLSNEIPEDLPLVRVDPQQIQQVFLNIISNSQFALNNKFSGRHEEKVIQIQGSVIKTEAGPYLRTIFTDHGTGIPNALLHKVTDPFFTTKPPGVGTGLGLSISSNIIKNHQGGVKIESRENEYTRVIIDLPLSKKDIDQLSFPEKGYGLCHGESHEI